MTCSWFCIDPKFVRSFQVLYEFERLQRMKIVLYDADEDRNVKDLKLDDQVPPPLFIHLTHL